MSYTSTQKQKPAKKGFVIFFSIVFLLIAVFSAISLVMCKKQYDYILSADRAYFKQVSYTADDWQSYWNFSVQTQEGRLVFGQEYEFDFVCSALSFIGPGDQVTIFYLPQPNENGRYHVAEIIKNGRTILTFDQIYSACQEKLTERTIAFVTCLLAAIVTFCLSFAIKPKQVTYEEEKIKEKYYQLKQEFEQESNEKIAERLEQVKKEAESGTSFWQEVFGLDIEENHSYDEWFAFSGTTLRPSQAKKPVQTQKPAEAQKSVQESKPVQNNQEQLQKPPAENACQPKQSVAPTQRIVLKQEQAKQEQTTVRADIDYQKQKQTRQSAKYQKFKESMQRESGRYVAKLFANKGSFGVVMQAVADVMFDDEFRIIYDKTQGDKFAFAFYKNYDMLYCRQVTKDARGLFYIQTNYCEWTFPKKQPMTEEQQQTFKRCLQSYQWFSPDEIYF